MSIKPRRQQLLHSDHRVIVHLALFLMCAMFSVLGMGWAALWCYFPAALVLELLSRAAPRRHVRRTM